ncbi:hypothetical protein ACGFZQ_37085, partial [Streptomyces sp. NPDC048254]
MPEQQILFLDPTGSDPNAEHQALRERGPATLVDILGVRAWSVSDPALLKQLLTSKDVSKDGRAHWPAFAETVPTWPLALWVLGDAENADGAGTEDADERGQDRPAGVVPAGR